MNKDTRKTLEDIKQRCRDLASEIETIRDDEQEKFDNMPEGLQQSEKGAQIEAGIDALNSAFDLVDGADSYLDDAISA